MHIIHELPHFGCSLVLYCWSTTLHFMVEGL